MSQQDHASYPGDDFDTFDATDEEGGLPGLVVLVMALLVLVAFGAVVWIAYQQGLRQGGRNAPPLIVAEPREPKVERDVAALPVDDREVYDVLNEDAEPRTQTIAAPPEDPIARPEPVDVADAGDVDAILDDMNRPARPEDDIEPLDRPFETAAATPPPAEPRVTIPAPSSSSSPGAQATVPTPTAVEPPRPAGASGGALAGTHVVQVSSSPTEAAANADWARLQGRYEDILAGRSRHVQAADLGDRGTFYRLRIGPFYSKTEADRFCATLKTRGQDCITRSAS